MILDKQLIFSEDQALPLDTTPGQSANVIDFGAADLDIGAGTPIFFNLFITTVSDSDVNTLTVELRDGATAAAADALLLFAAFVPNSTGLKIKCPLPSGVARYLSVYYTMSAAPGVGEVTAGEVTAFLSLD